MITLRAPNVRVLIVDDDEFALNVATGLFKSMEIKVRTVNSGVMALKAVQNGKYDIVFIDHLMPEMDGIETMHKIREFGGNCETLPLVALTGSVGENTRDMFLGEGFNDYLQKPLNINELCEVIKKYVPADKIEMQTVSETSQTHSKEDEKLIVDFARNNKETFNKITGLLSAGDMETARRTAHNLKSAAGYLKKKELQAAAFSLEESLGKATPEYTPEQLAVLEKELIAALNDFESLLNEADGKTQETVQVSNEVLTALLDELKPLLKKNDFGALGYVEKLRGIEGMGELADLIENYEFDGAYNSIQ
jgi:CheY-like chemotaxis protein/HPt (histidine-containing phosphotransfer) domain-containing protein